MFARDSRRPYIGIFHETENTESFVVDVSPFPTLASWRLEFMSSTHRDLIVQQIARHQSRLRAFLRCLLIRSSDIDDILQEVNVVLWEKADEFKAGTDFWAWASQVARFKVFNAIRQYGRERLIFDESVVTRLAEVAEQRVTDIEQRRTALEQCLQQLPPSQRQLIDLRYASGQAVETISKSIGRPAGSIKQTLYRIRETLLKCVESRLLLESGHES